MMEAHIGHIGMSRFIYSDGGLPGDPKSTPV